jgi:CO/xanthine dehydrogenase FAD-binding subunit
VKPPPFDYKRATSVDDAFALLAAGDEDTKVLAGGQSLVPLLNLRLARPSLLVDVNRVPGLDDVRVDDGTINLGATVRHARLLTDPVVTREAPLLRQAAALIGHPAIRNRGTLGGSLAHADPGAELCAAMVALDAEIEIGSRRGMRTVPATDFFLGPFMSVLEPDELVLAVRVARHGDHGCAYEECAVTAGDFALAGVAALVHCDDAGHLDAVRVAIAGAAGTAVPAPSAEELIGSTPEADRIERVVGAVCAQVNPTGDIHASADYKRALVGTLVRRALTRAAREAVEKCR